MNAPTRMALGLLAVLLSAGCSSVERYEARIADGPAKPADHPIYVYTEEVKCPRPYEILGTMHVSDTPLTMGGGSLEAVILKLRETARQKGADAIQVTSVDSPDFTRPHYRVDADFLRYTDTWETVALTEGAFRAYLRNPTSPLDPIEGIWVGNDLAQSRIGILKDRSRSGRDFVGFVLRTRNPSWRKGYKKMDIARGNLPAAYRISYYLDDFQAKGAAFSLGVPPAGMFIVHLPDDSAAIAFTKE